MNAAHLSMALRNKAAEIRQINVNTAAEDQALRDAADMLRVLANVIEGKPLAKALGSPGDWGYDTPIGAAIAAAEQ